MLGTWIHEREREIKGVKEWSNSVRNGIQKKHSFFLPYELIQFLRVFFAKKKSLNMATKKAKNKKKKYIYMYINVMFA